jgi:hypothetical protein
MRPMLRARAKNENTKKTDNRKRGPRDRTRPSQPSGAGAGRRRWAGTLAAIAAFILLMMPSERVIAGTQANDPQSQQSQNQNSPNQQAEVQSGQSGMPPANAKKFLQYIEQENSYKKWQLLPGTVRRQVGTSQAHGGFVTVYANQTAYQAAKKLKPYPDDSMLVKENYTRKFKLKGLSIMYKVKGYDPQGGDWFWVSASADGKKAKQSGKLQGCMDCHKQAGNGWVFGAR